MTDREQLHELRQGLKAIGAIEAVLGKYVGVGVLKADLDYIAQRKIFLRDEIDLLQEKLTAERIAELDQITTVEQAIALLHKEKHLPIRILLRKTEDGQYEGEVEHSFSLSWEKNLVGVYWSGTAYSNLGTTHQLDAVEHARNNASRKDDPLSIIVCNPLSTECPVEVDIVTWTKAFMNPKANKFDKRNAPMKQKGQH